MSLQELPDHHNADEKALLPPIHLLSKLNFPIVAIGASAGGLQAFTEVLKNLPHDTGMAFLYIQHARLQGKNNLVPLLARETAMPVLELTKSIHLSPNTVYVIPPEIRIMMRAGQLHAMPLNPASQHQMPIDGLFKTLSQHFANRVIGILLSGTTNDGTRGLSGIKRQGGLTIVQDKSARFAGLTQSATAAGAVQFILSPSGISRELGLISRLMFKPEVQNRNSFGRWEVAASGSEPSEIFAYLSKFHQTDLQLFSQDILERCLIRRMILNETGTFKDYLLVIRRNKDEADIFYQHLLLYGGPETRHTKRQLYLKENVFPLLLGRSDGQKPIRIWVPQFSSVTEVFSLAMVFLDLEEDPKRLEAVRILASTNNSKTLETARSGLCSGAEVRTLPQTQIRRFFTPEGDVFRVSKTVRALCHFLIQDLRKDPPFPNIDLLFAPTLSFEVPVAERKQIFKAFHQVLSDQGSLFLNKSEDQEGLESFFIISNPGELQFSKKPVSPATYPANGKYAHAFSSPPQVPETIAEPSTEIIKRSLDLYFGPAGVVVDKRGHIIEFFGDTAGFLQFNPGNADHDILKLVKPELRMTVKTQIPETFNTRKRIKSDPVIISDMNGIMLVTVSSAPVGAGDETSYILVVFTLMQISRPADLPAGTLKDSPLPLDQLRNVQLTAQLLDLAADIRESSETQSDVAAQLKRASEEILATNEELRSVNQELMAAQAEMETVHDELAAGNEQLQLRNDQLSESHAYSEAILATIQEAMVILDKQFQLKNANDVFYRLFGLSREECEGQNIFEIGNKEWNIPALRRLLTRVIPDQNHFQQFEVNALFQHTGEKTLLLSARRLMQMAHHNELILLSIVDTTDSRKLAAMMLEKQKQELENRLNLELAIGEAHKAADLRLQRIFSEAPARICMFRGPEHVVVLANKLFLRWFNHRQVTGLPVVNAFPELLEQGIGEILDNVYKTGIVFSKPEILLRTTNRRNGVSEGYFNLFCQPTFGSGEIADGVLMLAVETTDQVKIRQQIEQSEHRYHNLIYSSTSLIAILKGENFLLTIANDAILDVLGKGRDIVGKPYLEVVPEIAEQGFGNLLREVYRSGTPYFGYEVPLYLVRSGVRELFYFNFSYQAQRNASGEVEGISIIADEVTPQARYNKNIKEKGEQFQFIAETMPEKIWTADASGQFNYLNRLWSEYSGKRYDELIGAGWLSIVHPEDRPRTEEAWEKAISGGDAISIEHRLLSAVNNYCWHLTRAVAFQNENGEVSLWVGTSTEIHREKILKMELEEAVASRTAELLLTNNLLAAKNEELLKMNEELSSFSHISSHDLQEPLRKIQTFSARLLGSENERLSEKGKKDFLRIRTAADRMQQLILDLLAFSRLRGAEMPYEKVSLEVLIEQVVTDFAERLSAGGGKITWTRLPAIYCIPFQIAQVFQNLLSNSLKFLQPGVPPLIHIAFVDIDTMNPEIRKGTLYVHLTVTDNGIGFEERYEEQIFGVFQRLYSQEEYPGTGIGLAIVKKVMDNHKGFVSAKSVPGSGSTFHLYFPTNLGDGIEL